MNYVIPVLSPGFLWHPYIPYFFNSQNFLFTCLRSVKKISASTCSSKEKAGLKKNKMKNNYDDTKIVKSAMSEFSRGQLKVRMRCLGACIGRYGPIDYC